MSDLSVVSKTIEDLMKAITAKCQRLLVIILLTLILAGCATGHLTQVSDVRVSGPKVIALDAPSAPWSWRFKIGLSRLGSKYYGGVRVCA